MQFKAGDKVVIRDLAGTWRPGTVYKVDPGNRTFPITVRREDGSLRTSSDPSAVRLMLPEAWMGLDIDLSDAYPKDMSETIHLDEFNVTIPANSNSHKIERALEPLTAMMNRTPLQVDAEIWRRNHTNAQNQFDQLRRTCRLITGNDAFRPNAAEDCIHEFITKRGYAPLRAGAKRPSMDKETLQHFQNLGDDLAGPVIEAREARSILSQLDSWATHAEAGFVQPHWLQYGTPHGRYACEKPNVQQVVPVVRECVVPRPGRSLLSLDDGQAEYVTFASLSGDPLLKVAFESGRDLHEQMGKEILAAVPGFTHHEPNDRAFGKTMNFALLYLMHHWTLASRLGCTEEQATVLMDVYKARAPQAIAYRDDYIKAFQKSGSSTTHFGRRRELPAVCHARGEAQHALNKTLWHHHNAGTAAEILKAKTVRVMNALQREGLAGDLITLIMNMHDEIILEVDDSVLPLAKAVATDAFTKPIPGFVPFVLDVRTGKNWKEISK